jgi:peptide/nickel transport system substrate-binding protein
VAFIGLVAGAAPAQEKPAAGGRILDSLISEPDSLDPARAMALVSLNTLGLVYDRLIYLGADGKPKPWLAESWTMDKGGREVTFAIRQGVKFSDGTAVDAEAVRYSLDRFLKLSRRKADMGPLEKVEVAGPNRVRLTFGKPFAALWASLDSSFLGIVSKAAAEKEGEAFGRKPVGSGPYILKDWKPGSILLFARNANYKNLRADTENKGAPYPDEWQIQIVKEEGTRMAALETGQLHLAWAPFEEVPRIKSHANLQLIAREKGTSQVYLEFNTTKPPFNSLVLRRAIGFAVDPKEILDASYLYGTLTRAPLPAGVAGYSEDVAAKHGFRPDGAKALQYFQEAGYTKDASGKLKDKQGRPLKITLSTWVAPPISRAAQVIQAQLQAIGLEVELSQAEAGVFLAKLPEGKHDFDLMRSTYADAQGLSRQLKTPGRWKHYSNPKLDPVLDSADSTLDPEKRLEVLKQVQQMVLDDAAMIPLFSDSFLIAARKELRGYKFDAAGAPMIYDVWLKR